MLERELLCRPHKHYAYLEMALLRITAHAQYMAQGRSQGTDIVSS